MYLLDYILPQVAKLSRALQTKHLDLSLISSLVDATLNFSEESGHVGFLKIYLFFGSNFMLWEESDTVRPENLAKQMEGNLVICSGIVPFKFRLFPHTIFLLHLPGRKTGNKLSAVLQV